MRAQVISADFVMTFVVYLLALSLFFYNARSFLTVKNQIDINAPADLVLNRLDQVYEKGYDFIEGSKILNDGLENITNDPVAGPDPDKAYNVFFREFRSDSFRKVDYCVYLQRIEPDGSITIVRNFIAYDEDSLVGEPNSYIAPGTPCGTDGSHPHMRMNPLCNTTSPIESVVLTKPILFNKEIVDLKVMICAETI